MGVYFYGYEEAAMADFLFNKKVRIGGVRSVVNITIITITEKTSSDTTPSDLPIAAKIRPTSPLGTIPQPTIDLLTFPAASPATIFPIKAATVIPRATNNIERDYGGWGIRYGRKGKAFNVFGSRGLQLEFTNGKRLLIGSQKTGSTS